MRPVNACSCEEGEEGDRSSYIRSGKRDREREKEREGETERHRQRRSDQREPTILDDPTHE